MTEDGTAKHRDMVTNYSNNMTEMLCALDHLARINQQQRTTIQWYVELVGELYDAIIVEQDVATAADILHDFTHPLPTEVN